MPKEERIVCIGCPLGCSVRLTIDDKGEVIEVADNKCKEGKTYVIEEYKNPVRVLVATVLTRDSSHPLLPVRTNKPIVKGMLRQGMKELAQVQVKPPLRAGQSIITNLLGTGADVIATSDLLN